MYTGSLPAVSIYATWIENIEITSVDDGELIDLSVLTEITLRLMDPTTKFYCLIIKMTSGAITIPSPGIIEWRVETGHMGVLRPGFYEVSIVLSDGTTDIQLVLGTIPLIG